MTLAELDALPPGPDGVNYGALFRETAQILGRRAIPTGEEQSPYWRLHIEALEDIVSNPTSWIPT
jgi:hypothetical protein